MATAYVYYAHLARPLGDPNRPRMSARHYNGKATGLYGWKQRELEHRASGGCAVLAAANAAGIAWHISTVYECPDAATADQLEQLLKVRGHHDKNCAACQALARGEQPSQEPVIVPVASIADFRPRKPIAAMIDNRIARLQEKRARERAAKA